MPWIAGVDGCRSGWFVVMENGGGHISFVAPDFNNIINHENHPCVIAIDVPIGLLTEARNGGRLCDSEARRLLGKRHVTVFTPPIRETIQNENVDFNRAREITSAMNAQGNDMSISRQAHALLPKIREVNLLMNPTMQNCVYEVHPEISFYAMNNDSPIPNGKRSEDGFITRLELLNRVFPGWNIEQGRPRGVGRDDVLDAFAALWTARRILSGDAASIPNDAALERDATGLAMQIWR